MRAFADTSLVIDLPEGTVRGMRFAQTLTEPGTEWCFSALVRMECRVRPLAREDETSLALLDTIFAAMTPLSLTDEVYDRAARVRAAHGLKALDALHVATALEHGCAELWTADARLAKAARPSLTIRLVA